MLFHHQNTSMTFQQNLARAVNDEITIEEFSGFFSGKFEYTQVIIDGLYQACEHENKDLVEYLLIAADSDGVDQAYLKVLDHLLSFRWHEKEEDIVMMLWFDIGGPEIVDCLYKASRIIYDWDEVRALQRKCIRALHDIGTPEAKEKIKLIANTDDEHVRYFVRDFYEKNPEMLEWAYGA